MWNFKNGKKIIVVLIAHLVTGQLVENVIWERPIYFYLFLWGMTLYVLIFWIGSNWSIVDNDKVYISALKKLKIYVVRQVLEETIFKHISEYIQAL